MLRLLHTIQHALDVGDVGILAKFDDRGLWRALAGVGAGFEFEGDVIFAEQGLDSRDIGGLDHDVRAASFIHADVNVLLIEAIPHAGPSFVELLMFLTARPVQTQREKPKKDREKC
jgi:hypothetical protein